VTLHWFLLVCAGPQARCHRHRLASPHPISRPLGRICVCGHHVPVRSPLQKISLRINEISSDRPAILEEVERSRVSISQTWRRARPHLDPEKDASEPVRAQDEIEHKLETSDAKIGFRILLLEAHNQVFDSIETEQLKTFPPVSCRAQSDKEPARLSV